MPFIYLLISFHLIGPYQADEYNPIDIKLPYKIKKHKTIFTLLDGEKLSCYIIKIEGERILYVNQKNQVEMALIDNCSNCDEINGSLISSFQVKKDQSFLKTMALITLISFLFTIGAAKGSDNFQDSRGISFLVLITYGSAIITGIAFTLFLLGGLTKEKLWKDLYEFNRLTATYQYNEKMSQSHQILLNYRAYQSKKLTVYFNIYREKVKGYPIEKTETHFIVSEKKSKSKGELWSIPLSEINYIKE